MRLLFRATKEKLGPYIWRQDDPQLESKYANVPIYVENSDRIHRPYDIMEEQGRVRTAVCICLLIPIMCVMILLLALALMTMSSSSTTLNNLNDKWEGKVVRYTQQCGADKCSYIPNEEKIDCAPVGTINEATCTQRKCCWSPTSDIDEGVNVQLRISTPWCYYPLHYGGYCSELFGVTTPTGCTVDMHRKKKSQFIKDVETVRMDFRFETSSRLHVKIIDPKQARFESPYPKVPKFNGPLPSSPDYEIVVKKGSSGFNVLRTKTKENIFRALDIGDLIYSEQYLEISAILPKGTSIYGLGEHQGSLKVNDDQNWKLITMFNHDAAPTENNNLYGSHPFYLAVEPSGSSHGFFLMNSNAIDFIVSPNPAITIRTIGGILDMYFFLGPTPTDVIRQYAEVVGKPAMPPYWALGFHLSRFGYNSLEGMKEVWNRTLAAKIPFDTQWNDIDYMDSRNDFTYDKKNYAGLPEFVKELHEAGMHYVPIIDPGISAAETPGSYPPYDEGIKRDIFIKDSQGKVFVGKVWNSVSTVFPDFTNPNSVPYWTDMLRRLHDEVAFDGLWIDMNEPSNFYSGTATGCPSSPLEMPQYTPHVDGGNLSYKTVCMTAQQHAGKHYDVHNLYGISEAIATSAALTQIRGKRPLVISRSTFPGHGHFASHWTGDVFSTWYDMKMSVPQMLNFNMFQIPLVGADICGFNGNTTASLCLRWSQLGAFYPFSRNHNTDDGIDQDPVALGPEVAQAAASALQIRYELLPYLYTLFYNAHQTGDTVARPLFFEFPEDPKTLSIDDQFLWGRWLMIVPVLEEDATQVKPYLPKGLWYTFPESVAIKSNGTEITLRAPLHIIPILVRGGGILPAQRPAANTKLSRQTNFGLVAAPDELNGAEGELYWDDGESLDAIEKGESLLVKFKLDGSSLWSTPKVTGYKAPKLDLIQVYNVPQYPTNVTINDIQINDFQFSEMTKVLRINCNIDLKTPFHVEWN